MAHKAKVAKACKAMQGYGIADEKVKPVLKTLLRLYDKNWKHIEDENYRVLLDAIFDNADLKREETKSLEYRLRDEPEEYEPPLKRRSQNDLSSSTPGGGSSPNFSRSPTHGGASPANSSLIPYKRKGNKSSSPQISGLAVEPSVALSPDKNMLGKYPAHDQPLCEVPPAVVLPADPSFLEEDGSSHENLIGADEKCSEFQELTHKNTEDKSPQDGSSNEFFYNLEANGLDTLNSQLVDTDKKEDDGPKSSKIDIASSSNGEVKIALICNTSNQSNGHIPSIDSVLKAVEQCLKSYGIIEPGFSPLNLMKDVCELLSMEGTSSNGDERVEPVNVQPTLDVMKTFNRPLVPLNFSNGPLKHNLIQVLPHIPRPLTSNGFEFLQCIKGVEVNFDFFVGERDNKSKTFDRHESSSSSSMAIVHKDNSYYVVDDITRAEEDNKISLVNEINNECRPTFRYIRKNVTYKDAYVKFLLARISDENCCKDCSGDCLREIPCACAGETGGEFAYTPEGVVKEKFLEECISMNRDPRKHNLFKCKDCPLERSKGKGLSGKCKGHLVRKFIKECWYKCGCSFSCGNRVVQRGITVKLQIFMTPEGKGWGLRTLEDLPKGAFVCEYVGEIVTNTELYERNTRNSGEKHTYPVLLDADWGSEGVLKDEEALCLDATFSGNVARFVNHRCCDSNMVEIPVEVETPDHHYYHLAFFTTRKVNALEELTWVSRYLISTLQNVLSTRKDPDQAPDSQLTNQQK
ncbi:hypothetical protein LguiA_030501 [Lonicera macranthoides]